MHSVNALRDCPLIDVVYVATDSNDIYKHCQDNNILTLWRGHNATHPEEPLYNVLQWAYKTIAMKYDTIVSIMPNCPGHTAENVQAAIEMLENKKLYEVRSFDIDGNENGILALKENVLFTKHEISVYCGAVISKAKEIHYEKELEKC